MTIASLQRWTRDDWVIPCEKLDITGQPINLTGSVIAAELWIAGYRVFQPLTVANGGIVRVSDAQGKFRIVVPRQLTAQAKADSTLISLEDRTRVIVYEVNTQGLRQTLGRIFLQVFDGSELSDINEIPTVTLVTQNNTYQFVVATEQGDPGPNNISASQINDSSAVGQSIITADTIEDIRAILEVPFVKRTPVDDVNYNVKSTDTYVGIIRLTASRTMYLPPCSSYRSGLRLSIVDEKGFCSTDRPINIVPSGNDKIIGQAVHQVAYPYATVHLSCDGSGNWNV